MFKLLKFYETDHTVVLNTVISGLCATVRLTVKEAPVNAKASLCLVKDCFLPHF